MPKKATSLLILIVSLIASFEIAHRVAFRIEALHGKYSESTKLVYSGRVLSTQTSESPTPTDTTSSCTEPSGGCLTGYYWDSSYCSCRQYPSDTSTPYPTSTPSSCSEPSGGCGTGYYWDSSYCSCQPDSTNYCYPPSSGCGIDEYWDYERCDCISGSGGSSSCIEPSGGCGTGYYWDSDYCSCRTTVSECIPPSSGCASGKYWDFNKCSCVSYSSGSSSCTEPSGGCGSNDYWDSYTCSCKPYESSASECSPPTSGCTTNYYWDYYYCSCRAYDTVHSCTEPSGGCGDGWEWDSSSCYCRSKDSQDTYYSPYYSEYEQQQNYDRFSYESTERISCIKSKLTSDEYQKLRYLVPSNSQENELISSLGRKVEICWGYAGVTDQTQPSRALSQKSPIENEQCLVKALGQYAYKQIGSGTRQPTYEEHLKFEACYGKVVADKVSYLTEDQELPKTVNNCLKSVLKDKLYNSVREGKSEVPFDLQGKVDKCFGADAQPFEQGRNYKIPDSMKSCLLASVGETRFNEINSGKSQPTSAEKGESEACFNKLNQEQVKFLPVPPEQVPFLDEDSESISVASVNQEASKFKGKDIGGKVVISGKSLPNATVTIYIFSEPVVVTTKTDENGDFVYELNKPLEGETHIAYATAKDTSGNTVRSAIYNFSVVAAEDTVKQQLLEESNVSQDQRGRYIKLALLLIGGAFIIVSGFYTYLTFKKESTKLGVVGKSQQGLKGQPSSKEKNPPTVKGGS